MDYVKTFPISSFNFSGTDYAASCVKWRAPHPFVHQILARTCQGAPKTGNFGCFTREDSANHKTWMFASFKSSQSMVIVVCKVM
eukprot:g50141.t1